MILISRRGRLFAAEFQKHHMGFLKKIFDTPDRELFAFGNLSYAIAATFHTDNVHLLFGNATSQIMEQLAHLEFLHQFVLHRQCIFQRSAVWIQAKVDAEDFGISFVTLLSPKIIT